MKFEKEINQMTSKIVQEYKPEKIILFGSFAWGKPTASSDVDLFIVKNSRLDKRFRTTEVEKILDIPPLPVDIVVRTPGEVKYRKAIGDPFINLVLKKGKTLYVKG